MAGSRAVLSHQNGNLHAKILFIAEAPGRLGAALSGVPLCGDQSGRNFERLLAASGLTRADVFVTNAVLCNPLDTRGRNAAPTSTEQSNCLSYLARTIEVLDPALIVTLGAVALRSLASIEPHPLSLTRNVGAVTCWQGRALVPLFHPSPRAQIHRPFEVQLQDFVRLRRVIAALPCD
jgi:uracil-DNA glycosylase family 4